MCVCQGWHGQSCESTLSYLTEADSLGQLDFSVVQQLGELHSTVGVVATAVATFDRAAAMEPSDARIRQQRGACKDTLGDPTEAIEDLNAAIQLGLDDALTYTYRCSLVSWKQLLQT